MIQIIRAGPRVIKLEIDSVDSCVVTIQFEFYNMKIVGLL